MSKFLFGIVLFLGSFLLFFVQPLSSKAILPILGGAPAVWTACMLFFQCSLLLGYLYPHFVIRFLTSNQTAFVHTTLIVAAALLLPWEPPKISVSLAPELDILRVLSISVGIPFFLAATTSPLLQKWYANVEHGASPYRLYSLSNAASFLALFAYPALIEPYFTLSTQYALWSGLFLLFSLLLFSLTFYVRKNSAKKPEVQASLSEKISEQFFIWIGLSFVGSVLLLGGTNHITEHVAAVPLLWVIPLGLYLASFVVCFKRDKHYRRALWMFVLLCSVLISQMSRQGAFGLWGLMLSHLAVIFSGCMIAHGELAARKPSIELLTLYYIALSLGGMLGGVFVSIAAPHLFSRDLEYQLALAGLAVILFASIHVGRKSTKIIGALSIFTILVAAIFVLSSTPFSIRESRNFFGTLQILEHYDPTHGTVRELVHGMIVHGKQFLRDELRNEPTAYYGRESGAGITLAELLSNRNRRIGLVGLGAGTLAAYLGKGDTMRNYEINPDIVRYAEADFTFLKDARDRGAVIENIEGDGRLSLQREPAQQFDALFVDAFSGDAVPIHLLTLEAFQLYLSHLSENGILVLHCSNNFLSLERVIRRTAASLRLFGGVIQHNSTNPLTFTSTYVLLSRNENVFEKVKDRMRPFPANGIDFPTWTDQYSSIIQAAKW